MNFCRVYAAFLVTTLLLSQPLSAQNEAFLCAHDSEDVAARYDQTSVPRLGPYGTYRVLTVLVKFKDDTSSDHNFTGWPANAVQAPSFVSGFLDSSPNPSTFSDSSLTRSYYDQSRSPMGDALILYGDVYPWVVETDLPETAYYSLDLNNCDQNNCAQQYGGHGKLVKEVLDKIDNDVDFSEYDINSDGKIDIHIYHDQA